MDTTQMDTSIAHANALHRMLLQSLLSTRIKSPARHEEPVEEPVPVDAGETMPMLYRSEAFAEDLFESEAFGR